MIENETEYYRSIVNLKNSHNTNFDIFVKQLEYLADKVQKGIAQRIEEYEVRWDQGKLQILHRILSDIENAERKLKK